MSSTNVSVCFESILGIKGYRLRPPASASHRKKQGFDITNEGKLCRIIQVAFGEKRSDKVVVNIVESCAACLLSEKDQNTLCRLYILYVADPWHRCNFIRSCTMSCPYKYVSGVYANGVNRIVRELSIHSMSLAFKAFFSHSLLDISHLSQR
jgi:succinate dehydrogenase/fumarate reductase-like Fe-S protein